MNPNWVKGVSGNPAGKPKGSKDKKWASLDHWFGLVQDEWTKLEPKDRAHIAIDAWKALLARNKVPLTPQESVQNAEAAMKLLKLMQEVSRNGSYSGIIAGSTTPSLDNGGSESQASEASAPSV
jgi:hypothetical protein